MDGHLIMAVFDWWWPLACASWPPAYACPLCPARCRPHQSGSSSQTSLHLTPETSVNRKGMQDRGKGKQRVSERVKFNTILYIHYCSTARGKQDVFFFFLFLNKYILLSIDRKRVIKKSWKQCITISTKITCSTTFQHNNIKCFLSSKSAYYNYLTLKIGVKDSENVTLSSQE